MSECISRHGEFGSHALDDLHTCTRCYVLDEDTLRAELALLRAQSAEAEDRGYRRAVQALRDEAADFTFEEGRDHSFRFAADFLEHRAAAPRIEGTQT